MAKQVTEGAFTGVGVSETFAAFRARSFNISVWGTFVGTIAVQRSFDNGATWLSKWPSEVYSINEPRSFSDEEPEYGVLYRLACTAFTSGTINYRLSA